MEVKDMSENEEDFALLLVEEGIEVKILIPKRVFEWARAQKTEEYTEYGLNLVTKGHYV